MIPAWLRLLQAAVDFEPPAAPAARGAFHAEGDQLRHLHQAKPGPARDH